jgi:PRC-barrel domain protein
MSWHALPPIQTITAFRAKDVQGTKVYGPDGKNIGEIDHLIIDKMSGRVAYAVMSFGGFMGLGHSHYPIPGAPLLTISRLVDFAPTLRRNNLRTHRSSATTLGKIASGRLGHIVTTVHRNIGKRERACSSAAESAIDWAAVLSDCRSSWPKRHRQSERFKKTARKAIPSPATMLRVPRIPDAERPAPRRRKRA